MARAAYNAHDLDDVSFLFDHFSIGIKDISEPDLTPEGIA